MSVSRSSDKKEYVHFLEFVGRNGLARLKDAVPTWDQVKNWRGMMVAEMDYEVGEKPGPSIWDEGYRYWWKLSNVKLLDEPYPVRGNVGMWAVE